MQDNAFTLASDSLLAGLSPCEMRRYGMVLEYTAEQMLIESEIRRRDYCFATCQWAYYLKNVEGQGLDTVQYTCCHNSLVDRFVDVNICQQMIQGLWRCWITGSLFASCLSRACSPPLPFYKLQLSPALIPYPATVVAFQRSARFLGAIRSNGLMSFRFPQATGTCVQHEYCTTFPHATRVRCGAVAGGCYRVCTSTTPCHNSSVTFTFMTLAQAVCTVQHQKVVSPGNSMTGMI